MECDNVFACHELKILEEERNAMRVICIHCWGQYVIRKHHIKDVPENRQYSKIFKKDILQGNESLFYKYHPEFLRV